LRTKKRTRTKGGDKGPPWAIVFAAKRGKVKCRKQTTSKREVRLSIRKGVRKLERHREGKRPKKPTRVSALPSEGGKKKANHHQGQENRKTFRSRKKKHARIRGDLRLADHRSRKKRGGKNKGKKEHLFPSELRNASKAASLRRREENPREKKTMTPSTAVPPLPEGAVAHHLVPQRKGGGKGYAGRRKKKRNSFQRCIEPSSNENDSEGRESSA